MTIDHAALSAVIRNILETNTTPGFGENGVFGGPIRGLPPGGPYANYRYRGRGNERSEHPQTIVGQVFITETWEIAVFFLCGPERETLADLDLQVADADAAIQAAFRARATLDGESSPTLTIGESAVIEPGRFVAQPSGEYLGIRFALYVKDREAEGTTP